MCPRDSIPERTDEGRREVSEESAGLLGEPLLLLGILGGSPRLIASWGVLDHVLARLV